MADFDVVGRKGRRVGNLFDRRILVQDAFAKKRSDAARREVTRIVGAMLVE